MYIIIKVLDDAGNVEWGKDIFARPTPWGMSIRAFFHRSAYRFAAIPPTMQAVLTQCDATVEDGVLVLTLDGEEVVLTPIVPMTWAMWIVYELESFAHGWIIRWREQTW